MKRKRRGQSLVFFMLFLLALVSLLALILDFGFVLLSRRTMQTAVNTAALEGARNCNDEGREDAREIMRNVFDDDLDPTENLTTLEAGPQQSLIQRDANDNPLLGDGDRCELYDNRHQYIYRPNPELNTDNEVHGDFVVGDYTGNPTSDHLESGDYTRNDFQSTDAGLAFLARLRRTPSRTGIANSLDREDGVSSSGLGSPLLIGHLAPFVPSADGEYDVRRDGVTIRATAIADNRPIMHVGTATGGDDGFFVAVRFAYHADDNEWYELSETQHSIGQVAQFSDPMDPVDIGMLPDSDVIGYAPVVRVHLGVPYVVGFRLIDRGSSQKQNASPRLQDAWAALRSLETETRAQILVFHRELADADDSVLARVPALVRTVR